MRRIISSLPVGQSPRMATIRSIPSPRLAISRSRAVLERSTFSASAVGAVEEGTLAEAVELVGFFTLLEWPLQLVFIPLASEPLALLGVLLDLRRAATVATLPLRA